jgi:chromosome partitioning protein
MFVFGGTLAGLDPSQVANLPAARNNARSFAAEVIEILKASMPVKQPEQVA